MSRVRVNTTNGYGSTSTAIRRWTNVLENVGGDITYADSATLGGSFTINTPGMYSISYTDVFNLDANMGVSRNTTQGGTSVGAITASTRLASTLTTKANAAGSCSWSGWLNAGDVIRAHTEGLAYTDARQDLTISRVG